MITRNTPRIDYKVLHETGRRELKKMDAGEFLDKVKIEELKIRADLDHLLEVHVLAELDDVDDISDAASEISDIGQRFRHIHVELSSLLGKDHDTTYPDYKKVTTKLVKFSKEARKKIGRLEN